MATIQVRGVPDDVHRTFRLRAATASMSLQEYLKAELVRAARRRSPAEVVADVEERLRVDGPAGFLPGSSAEAVRAERDGR